MIEVESRPDGVSARPTPEEPIDFFVVREAVRRAESLPLNSCTRTQFYRHSEVLSETLRRLLREDYPDPSPETTTAFRVAYRLVDHPCRPTSNDSAFRLHQHVRNLARAAGMLADVLSRRPQGSEAGPVLDGGTS